MKEKKKPLYKGSKGNVYKVDLHNHPDLIQAVPGFNQRVDYGDMDWLVASMKAEGMKVPAQGYNKDGIWYITDGHRRLKAAQIIVADGGEVVFTIQAEPKGYTDKDRFVDMITRNSGLPLSMIEEGRVYSKLISFGYTDNMVAEKINKSVVHVRNALSLLEVPDSLQKNIEEGKVAASTVVGMVKKMDPKEVEKNVDEALKKTGKKRVTGKDIKGAASGKDRSTDRPKTVDGDDLTKVKGVGDRVAVILKENGIDTFKKMAKTHVDTFKTILKENGMSKFRNPAKWSALAHDLAYPDGGKSFQKPDKPVEKEPPAPPQLPALLDMEAIIKKLEKSAANVGGVQHLKFTDALNGLKKFAVGDISYSELEDIFIA